MNKQDDLPLPKTTDHFGHQVEVGDYIAVAYRPHDAHSATGIGRVGGTTTTILAPRLVVSVDKTTGEVRYENAQGRRRLAKRPILRVRSAA